VSDGAGSPRLRHIKAEDYNPTFAAVGFARGRFGAARSSKTMEEELRAKAPKPGEGQRSTPDPFLFRTIQPDAERQLPPEFRLEQQREGAAAYGVALQETVRRLPQHDELIAEHLELSYDGETVSHEKLEHGIASQSRTSAYLAIVLVTVAVVATLALLLAGWAHNELGAAARQMHDLRARIEQIEQRESRGVP
jgi:hypothetical protein